MPRSHFSSSSLPTLAVALSVPLLPHGCAWTRPPGPVDTRKVDLPVVIDPNARDDVAHDNELDAAILARDFARSMEASFRPDLARSKELRLEKWNRRPFSQRVKEHLSRLISCWS